MLDPRVRLLLPEATRTVLVYATLRGGGESAMAERWVRSWNVGADERKRHALAYGAAFAASIAATVSDVRQELRSALRDGQPTSTLLLGLLSDAPPSDLLAEVADPDDRFSHEVVERSSEVIADVIGSHGGEVGYDVGRFAAIAENAPLAVDVPDDHGAVDAPTLAWRDAPLPVSTDDWQWLMPSPVRQNAGDGLPWLLYSSAMLLTSGDDLAVQMWDIADAVAEAALGVDDGTQRLVADAWAQMPVAAVAALRGHLHNVNSVMMLAHTHAAQLPDASGPQALPTLLELVRDDGDEAAMIDALAAPGNSAAATATLAAAAAAEPRGEELLTAAVTVGARHCDAVLETPAP